MTRGQLFKDYAMTLLERFKRDIARHRAKALVLGVLFLAMIGLSVKAVLELHPQAATAAGVSSTAIAAEPAKASTNVASEMDVQKSALLRKQLAEVKSEGLPAMVAFTFEPSFYTPDPSRIVAVAPQPTVE